MNPTRQKFLACTGSAGLALMTPLTVQADVASGLTAYWNFDNNLTDQAPSYPFSAGTTADDAAFINAPDAGYGTGLFGQAYQGTGGAGHAAIPLSDDISGVLTGHHSVSFWFKILTPISTWQAAIAVGEGNAWRVARAYDSSPLLMGYAGGSSDIYSTTTFGTPAAPVADWHHVVAVTEGGVATRLYIDGVLESTGAAPTLTVNGSGELWIGGNPQAGGRAWNGSLDDIGIWNRVLTAADIQQIFTQGKNNAKSLGVLLTEENLDTDGDGMPDVWEIAHLPAGAQLDNGSVNPAFGPAGDPDNDQSPNLQEFTRRTKPQLADTDTDGLKDGAETNTGTYTSTANTGTDPLKADTDGDGLKDGVENPTLPYAPANAANQPGTSPFLPDTDGDTFPDGIEVTYGSNPTDIGSVPSAGGLPITDTFEDGIFDPARWSTDLNVAVAGAAVAEQGGHITLTGRGHFFTREEFDPVALNGIYLTGKWTFRSADDFVQILTRSDAFPAGQYGETQEGVEFYASQTDNSINISTRGGSFTVGAQQRSGVLTLLSGRTYQFTLIDAGSGYLSLRLTDTGNPANTAIINAEISSSAAVKNHVVFHNREGARTSHLEEVVIGRLTDTDGDTMPDFWETAYGLDKNTADAAVDQDTDGFTNLEEYRKGLDPKKNDTDGDGLADGKELHTGVWVSAADTGTDPLRADSDGDGLNDSVETRTGIFISPTNTGSDPNVPDTDGDGLGDGSEVAVGRNPVNPNDGQSGLRVGLTTYWNFDGTLNDIAHSAALGESTVADNGTFTGAPDVGYAATGRFGSSALNLNGGAGWVTVPKSADTIGNVTTRNVSVSLWLKANAFDSNWQAAISHGEGSHWRIARQSNVTPAHMAYAGGSGDIYSATTFDTPTDWYHVVAVTTEGSGTALYINGVLESTGGEPNLDIQLAAATNLYIGANPQSAGREWNGQIDDVAIWTRPLTTDEITSIYEEGSAGRSLGSLLGMASAPSIAITSFSYNAATHQVTLVWTSAAGTNYTINYSTGLNDWTGTINNSYPGTAPTTTYTFPVPAAVSGASKLFFRVKAN